MTARTIWNLSLILAFFGGLLGVAKTGDVRWLALSVVPGAIFAKWWRI